MIRESFARPLSAPSYLADDAVLSPMLVSDDYVLQRAEHAL